jgi:hypothetical protein
MRAIFLLIMFLLVATPVYAGTWQTCNWIWSTDVTSANDPPDFVYCKKPGYNWKSKGASYIQSTRGADNIAIQYDTTWDNSKTINGKTPCSNTAATGDLNVLSCIDSVCDTGTTTLAYHQVDDIADNINLGFELTPPTEAFKLSVDGDTATCWVIRTTVYWESN